MMKRWYWFGVLSILSMQPALACSQMQPVAAFVFINDTNKDKMLSMQEWQMATSRNLVTSFQVGNLDDFARLDFNQDQQLQAAELGFDSVRYIREPCEDWEERMLRHSRFKSQLQQ